MVTTTDPHEEQAFEDICLSSKDIRTRRIGLNDLWQSLREGYEDFSAKPSSAVPFLILFYSLAALFFTLFAFGQELRYMAFPIVAGFTLVGPVVAIGFFSMSRRREVGKELRWSAAFGFIHTHHFAPILALSLVMTLLYIGWLYMAELIFFSLFEDFSLASMPAFLDEVFSTRHGGALIAYGNFVGFLFAFAAMALSVVAFPLALDKPVTSITAMKVSVRAFTENAYVLAVWGIVVVAVLAVGAALFLIGLAVVLPVLGHATWHLYRKLVAN